MKHELKTLPEFFQALWCGDKTFEIRENDRDFKERDEIVLREYEPESKSYTGRKINGFITYVTDFKQQPGYIVFSFRESRREFSFRESGRV